MKSRILMLTTFCSLCVGGATESLQVTKIQTCQKPVLTSLEKLRTQPMGIQKEIEGSRLNFYLGRCALNEDNAEIAIPFFEQGQERAEAAIEISKEDPSASFWWAANKGAVADLKRNMGALKTVKEVEERLKTIRLKDPLLAFSGPDRVLGKIYQKAPRFISIGSSSKAEDCFNRALEKFPKFPGNIIAMAEFYDDEGRKEEAQKLITKLMASQEIESGDYGAFNIEKDEWNLVANHLIKKWDTKSE